MYKSSDEFTENVGFNEKLLWASIHIDKDNKNNKSEEKRDKIKKSNFNLNSSIITSEIGLSNPITDDTTKNDKENDIKNEVSPNQNSNSNNDIKKRSSSKVHFDDIHLFEMMNDDDPDYYILDDYKEVDSSEDND